jgi:hypothetical protein
MRCYFLFLLLVQRSAATAQSVKVMGDNAGQIAGRIDSCREHRSTLSLVTEFAGTAVFQQSLAALEEKVRQEPAREFTVAFGKDSLGRVGASGFEVGSKRSAVVAALPSPVADMHNHPGNTPPSSGDLYGLIAQNSKNSNYTMRFVITPGASMYVLVITNSPAVQKFATTYPAQQMPGYSPLFPDKLLEEYRDILYRYGATEETAMAFMLEKYKTGVLLLKRKGGGPFLRLWTTMSGTGDQQRFIATTCRQ